jgi:CRISPR system Cascade subunit CasE
MFFSRIALPRAGADLAELARVAGGDGYRLHQHLWQLFAESPEQRRDFLYHRSDSDGWPAFYAVSEGRPEDRTGLWRVESKPYVPKLRSGQRLAFQLRANPVCTRSDEDGRPHRHDVVMDAKRRLSAEGIPKERWPSHAELVQREGLRWLQARAERHGFAVAEDGTRVEGYQLHRYDKARGKPPIRLATVDIVGWLFVVDAERLLHTLFHGIGPAKAFGCGLTLVRRA